MGDRDPLRLAQERHGPPGPLPARPLPRAGPRLRVPRRVARAQGARRPDRGAAPRPHRRRGPARRTPGQGTPPGREVRMLQLQGVSQEAVRGTGRATRGEVSHPHPGTYLIMREAVVKSSLRRLPSLPITSQWNSSPESQSISKQKTPLRWISSDGELFIMNSTRFYSLIS